MTLPTPTDILADEAVTKLSPEMQAAWTAWNPGFDPEPPLSVRQATFVRSAFFDGWFAALRSQRDLIEEAANIVFEEVGNHTVCSRVMRRIRALSTSTPSPKVEPIGYACAEHLSRRAEFERNGSVIYASPCGTATMPVFAAPKVEPNEAGVEAELLADGNSWYSYAQREEIARQALTECAQLAEDPSEDAYLGRSCWDERAISRNWGACQNRLEEIRDRVGDALRDLSAPPAAGGNGEPIAWLYEIPGSNVRRLHFLQVSDLADGWTETPLIAALASPSRGDLPSDVERLAPLDAVSSILADHYEWRMLKRCIHPDVHRGAANRILAALGVSTPSPVTEREKIAVEALKTIVAWDKRRKVPGSQGYMVDVTADDLKKVARQALASLEGAG